MRYVLYNKGICSDTQTMYINERVEIDSFCSQSKHIKESHQEVKNTAFFFFFLNCALFRAKLESVIQ